MIDRLAFKPRPKKGIRVLQAEGTECAKVLKRNIFWCAQETANRMTAM